MGDRDVLLEALSCVNELEEAVEFIEMTDEDLEPIPLEHWLSKTRNIRQALERQRVPTGWKPVPMVPTDRMMREGMGADSTAINAPTALNCYYAMLAAAPEVNDG